MVIPSMLYSITPEKNVTCLKGSLISVAYLFLKNDHYSFAIEKHVNSNGYQIGFLSTEISDDYNFSVSKQIIPEFRRYINSSGFFVGAYSKIAKLEESDYMQYDEHGNILPPKQILLSKYTIANLAFGPSFGYKKYLTKNILIEAGAGVGGKIELSKEVEFGGTSNEKKIKLDGIFQINAGYVF